MGAASFINSVNTDYEALHKSFEEQFWGTKMALSDERFSVPELTRTKGEMEAFLADEQKLKTTREHLAKASELSEAEQKTLALTWSPSDRSFVQSGVNFVRFWTLSGHNMTSKVGR